MAIAVVGFDLGFLNSYVAVARAGGIETVANEYSDRCTSSCISFSENLRYIGHSAKQRVVTNMRDTVYSFAKFLGKNFDDPRVQAEIARVPYKVVKSENGGVAFEVNYLNERTVFSAEQMTAMMLTKLKHVGQSNLGTQVVDCVLNVPTYFNDRERRALLDATQIAGLNCLKLINDMTAVGLNYGIYKKDLPAVDKAPKIVAFVDMGHSDLQVAIIAFNDGQMKVLSSSSDPVLGGRDLDRVIFEYFADEIASKQKLDVRSNAKATVKLMEECSKVKKLMSANSTDIPLNIECLMEDRDVSGRINRETFQQLLESAGILGRIESCLSRSLELAKLKSEDLSSVEIVGGSTRVPIVKEIVSKVFGQMPKTTLNADEAVARGCALMCAILSPAFKVREFSITDWQPYAISLSYQEDSGNDDNVEVFPIGYQFPMSRTLTFSKKSAFELAAFYSGENTPEPLIGKFRISNVQPDSTGAAAKIKVKVRLNSHGIFTVSQAKLAEVVEKVEEAPANAAAEKMETDSQQPKADAEEKQPAAAAESASSPMDVAADESAEQATADAAAASADAPAAADGQQKPADKKVKKVTKYSDLPVEVDCVKQLSKKLLIDYQELEANMVLQEAREHERSLARNSVEEYVYEMRDKLSSSLEKFVSEPDRESFGQTLTATEDWLYGDGENVSKQVYEEKLAELHKVGDSFVKRAREAEERPKAADAFGHAIQHARKILDSWRAKDEAYNHLTEEEIQKVSQAADDKQQWLITQLTQQEKQALTEDPKLLAADIRAQHSEFESLVSPILNRPKPKVEPPPAEQQGSNTNASKDNGDATAAADAASGKQPAPDAAAAAAAASSASVNGGASGKEADMDLD